MTMTLTEIQKKMAELVKQAYELGARVSSDTEPGPKMKPKPVEDDGFQEIWEAYTQPGWRVGKQQAQRRWRRMGKREKELALQAVPKYTAVTCPHGAGGKRYRAHLATWLNQRRWEDEILPQPQPQPSDDGIITLE